MSVYLFVPGFTRDPADLFRAWGVSDGVYSAVLDRDDVLKSGEGGGGGDGGADASEEISSDVAASDSSSATSFDCGRCGMTLARDATTGDVVVVRATRGGAAANAGVAPGSVLVALAVGTAADAKVRLATAEEEREGAAVGGDSVISLDYAAELLRDGNPKSSDDNTPSTPTPDAASEPEEDPDRVELWLRRNLRASANAEAGPGALSGALPEIQLWDGVVAATKVLETPRSADEEAAAAAELQRQWPLKHGEQHVVAWEHAALSDLGRHLASFGKEHVAGYAAKGIVAQVRARHRSFCHVSEYIYDPIQSSRELTDGSVNPRVVLSSNRRPRSRRSPPRWRGPSRC
jgi:hypothetical protein